MESRTFSVHTGNGQSMEQLLVPKENNIIIATDGPLGKQNQDQTGDVDYATRIAERLCQELIGAGVFDTAVYYQNANTKAFVIKNFLKEKTNRVFHLMLNPPWTGCGIDIEFLKLLKTQGFKIIITAIEFAMYENAQHKHKMFEYFPYADQIIFLDEQDRLEAQKFANLHSESLKSRLEQSKIITVPPTIDSRYITTQKTGNNIISFGMIRSGKGFNHTLRLAELIKESNGQQQIYIVGSVQKAAIRIDDAVYDATLYDLLCKLYPAHKPSFEHKSPEKLMKIYNEIKSSEEPVLPVKLFLDISESELTKLFSQCEYAFYAAYRGATLRNSSVSTCLAFGCVLYSHIGEITPACLRREGTYADAMILADSNDESTYAKFVFDSIRLRERNKSDSGLFGSGKWMNQKTREAAAALSNNELSLENVVRRHKEIYGVEGERCQLQRTLG